MAPTLLEMTERLYDLCPALTFAEAADLAQRIDAQYGFTCDTAQPESPTPPSGAKQ